MTFASLIHFVTYSSGLPPDFRCVFVILHKTSDLCTLQDLRNGSYYATRYYSMSYQFDLVQFTYVSDELIFILKEN